LWDVRAGSRSHLASDFADSFSPCGRGLLRPLSPFGGEAAGLLLPPLRGKAGMGGLLLWFSAKRCFKFAGGSPAATYFLLNGQEKVSKEKAALVSRPYGLPCVTQRAGRLRNSPLPRSGRDSDSPRRNPRPVCVTRRLTRDSNSVLISACDSCSLSPTVRCALPLESRRAAQIHRGKSASTV
jgi:hypothetical protein